MKYKGRLKSLEEIIKNSDVLEINASFLKFVIDNQNKELICVIKHNISFIVDGKFGFTKEDFSELEEIKKNEVWKPEIGEKYCFINSIGQSLQEKYEKSIDQNLFSNYNNFKTKEQSELVQKKIKLIMAQMEWKFQNDDIEKIENNWYLDLNKMYFSSEKKCDDCLKSLKKEGLL
jgi:hypothetical protein